MYKKSWKEQYGVCKVISEDNSYMSLIEVDMVKLRPGDTKKYSEEDKEYGITILGGTCDIVGEGFSFTLKTSVSTNPSRAPSMTRSFSGSSTDREG